LSRVPDGIRPCRVDIEVPPQAEAEFPAGVPGEGSHLACSDVDVALVKAVRPWIGHCHLHILEIHNPSPDRATRPHMPSHAPILARFARRTSFLARTHHAKAAAP
jgi:hypothetical protein